MLNYTVTYRSMGKKPYDNRMNTIFESFNPHNSFNNRKEGDSMGIKDILANLKGNTEAKFSIDRNFINTESNTTFRASNIFDSVTNSLLGNIVGTSALDIKQNQDNSPHAIIDFETSKIKKGNLIRPIDK